MMSQLTISYPLPQLSTHPVLPTCFFLRCLVGVAVDAPLVVAGPFEREPRAGARQSIDSNAPRETPREESIGRSSDHERRPQQHERGQHVVAATHIMSSCQVLAPISVGSSAAAASFWPHYHQQQHQILPKKKQWKCQVVDDSAVSEFVSCASLIASDTC
jgi:hypothetical protein